MIETLIKKYFDNSCSEQEKQEILAYFRAHSAELDKYFNEFEWSDFEPYISRDGVDATRALNKIVSIKSKKSARVVLLRKISAAALLILFFGIAAYYFLSGNLKEDLSVTHSIVHTSQMMIDSNNSDKPLKIALPDNSTVLLYPHSHINYLQKFQDEKRDVTLYGRAVFFVSHDPSRPFTVYCGEVATTALGTVFKVSETTDHHKVNVQLIQGKILVRSTLQNDSVAKKYYLLPGNEIEFNSSKNEFTYLNNKNGNKRREGRINTDIAITSPVAKNNTIKMNMAIQIMPGLIKFNNVSLSEVLDVLASKRGINIAYPTNKVANIKFIGSVSDTASTKKILSDLASMNNFSMIDDSANNRYIIY